MGGTFNISEHRQTLTFEWICHAQKVSFFITTEKQESENLRIREISAESGNLGFHPDAKSCTEILWDFVERIARNSDFMNLNPA
jgi:hypothetical protein